MYTVCCAGGLLLAGSAFARSSHVNQRRAPSGRFWRSLLAGALLRRLLLLLPGPGAPRLCPRLCPRRCACARNLHDGAQVHLERSKICTEHAALTPVEQHRRM